MEDYESFKQEAINEIVKLENQIYVLYLQLNVVCKYLADQGLLDPEKMIGDMNELNEALWAADEANVPESVPAVAPVTE